MRAVRRTLFAKNMPLVHKKDGRVVAEYADGRIEIIRWMPLLFIIAGPPDIGKSSSGKLFQPPNIEVLNHDALFIYYKDEDNYEDLSNLKANEFIQQKLSKDESFGVEINLGYDCLVLK